MTNITLLGIDLAKNVFQLHGVDKTGKAVLKKQLTRQELKEYVANLPPCTIAMEACGGSHYWARKFQAFGHEVKLISPQFVKPFVKTNKNDAHDAEAIIDAASRPNMRFVPIKAVEHQDIQSVHRLRERLVTQRTALVNQARGLLAEYGVVVAKVIPAFRKAVPRILEDAENELTFMTRELVNELYEELLELEKKMKVYDNKIKTIFTNNSICKKLAKIEGIGPVTATILLTLLGNPNVFKNGRHFAAFLGLVPRQNSSGGKHRLLGISKRGDSYLRCLFVHGARSVLRVSAKKSDKRSVWLQQLKERRGYNRSSVALANKNARIAWSIVANDTEYTRAA